jgi:hypothetical protein
LFGTYVSTSIYGIFAAATAAATTVSTVIFENTATTTAEEKTASEDSGEYKGYPNKTLMYSNTHGLI